MCCFTSLLADVSLTTPWSLLPAAPVNTAGPSLSKLEQLQERLDLFHTLAAEEIGKGADCNHARVAMLQKERKLLQRDIDRHSSGEIQHHRSVLSNITRPRLKMSHQHAYSV